MKILFLLLLPSLSFAQLSVHDVLETYARRQFTDSAFDYVGKKGYRIASVKMDTSGYSTVVYAKDQTTVNFEGTGGVHIVQYRTPDSTEFNRWHHLILSEGFVFKHAYSGEGKHYWLFKSNTDTVVYFD